MQSKHLQVSNFINLVHTYIDCKTYSEIGLTDKNVIL